MRDRRIRVLLADDHSVVRRGLRIMIESEPDIEVVAQAKDGREAVQQAAETRPDVVVMDLSMPELNGIECTRQIVDLLPRTKVVVLSMHKDGVYVREALRAGARAYLPKDSEDDSLASAIRAVYRGDAYLSPSISDVVLTDYRKHVTDPIDLLTGREREVLSMIADGKTNKEIANILSLSVYTVEAHRGKIMEKLNLHNTGDIVRFAARSGLLR
ncbi:MAG: response regulator transcription factor [Bryobacterales bacterium]|nr:response regulator transcription factor [Acidobacteriota bacterium]MCB9383563.1 response regulator transcription factor [Bryobacterales bacterium]